MKRNSFKDKPCSIARSLDVIGDWWNPLIIRECLYGVNRFDDMQRWLGIGRNILTGRLALLVEHGLLEKRRYQERPPRYEYHLTDRGYDAAAILLPIMQYGEKWLFSPDAPPVTLFDRRTGNAVKPVLVDENTGKPVDMRELFPGPGPAFPGAPDVRKARFTEYYDRLNDGYGESGSS